MCTGAMLGLDFKVKLSCRDLLGLPTDVLVRESKKSLRHVFQSRSQVLNVLKPPDQPNLPVPEQDFQELRSPSLSQEERVFGNRMFDV